MSKSEYKYIVNAELGLERLEDKAYSKAHKVADKWEPLETLPDEYCGNAGSVG